MLTYVTCYHSHSPGPRLTAFAGGGSERALPKGAANYAQPPPLPQANAALRGARKAKQSKFTAGTRPWADAFGRDRNMGHPAASGRPG